MPDDLLRLLEIAHPGKSHAELLAIIEATPDARPAKSPQKPAQRRVGSRPRTGASMERRRSWAASGRMPPKLAARFTLAEQAVLAVIAAEVARHGACTLTLDHIAALAGVCRTTVRNAQREAAALGLIRVEERRVSAWRNASNKVTIICPAWASWLRLGRRGGGLRSVSTTTIQDKNSAKRSSGGGRKGLPAGPGPDTNARNAVAILSGRWR